MEKGYLAFILHAHLPFVRHPEYEDSLEEYWLFEAITETYIPLLAMLEKLAGEGVAFRLTFSLTPTLASMLEDSLLQSRYLRRIEHQIELAAKEMQRTRHQPEFHRLARMYYESFSKAKELFTSRYKQNLLQAFRRLQELGFVELIASAATHGYLPLLSVNPSSVSAQIRVGVDRHREAFGQRPGGFWLPECGYYPGIDTFLREEKIRYTILESHGITRADVKPIYGVYAPLYCPSGVAVFGRDPESSKQVWSSVEGYPGDFDYREFYRDIAYDLEFEYIKPYVHEAGIRIDTGIKYYRITGQDRSKEAYIPERAEQKAHIHAENFLDNREKQIDFLASAMDRKPIIVAPYDAELFGHWWFEGPIWLEHVIRNVASKGDALRLVTLSEYLEMYPINQVSVPSMSSWGYKGFSEVWLNGSNDWIYPDLHRAGDLMAEMARDYPNAKGITRRALNQAARELLLAQASDWAFMLKLGVMTEYATKRTRDHLLHSERLFREVRDASVDKAWLSLIESRDNIFPHIDYRVFSRPKQKSVHPRGSDDA
ncbi:MAG TPA: 1,4-alpha-glucan branching protein domain-containing protein [Syntrophorhabdales bacterium]|nr:1,4-alpha-glucan branching protein domain-containing protein [Syntrophorhabdales bacterium]